MPRTFYEYDDDGRITASWAESEWDDEQRGFMLGLSEYQASRCPCGCGHAARDTTAQEGTATRFTVGPPVRCLARDALLMAQDQYSKTPRNEALLFSVIKGG